MKKDYIKRIVTIVGKLEALMEDIESDQFAMWCIANTHNRGLTQQEQAHYDDLDSAKEQLQAAADLLSPYAEK